MVTECRKVLEQGELHAALVGQVHEPASRRHRRRVMPEKRNSGASAGEKLALLLGAGR